MVTTRQHRRIQFAGYEHAGNTGETWTLFPKCQREADFASDVSTSVHP